MAVRATHPIDVPLLILVLAMTAFGFLMLASASAPMSYDQFGDGYYLVKHQLIFGLLPGVAGLLFFARVPYIVWRKYAWFVLLGCVVALIAVFIPGISSGIGTAHSWIAIGPWFSLQPSEIVKLGFLFYLAAWLERRGEEGVRDINGGFLPFILVLGILMLLLVLQPDIGTMSIIAAMSLVVYFAAGAPLRFVAGFLAIGVVALTLLVSFAPYRAARLTTFLNPELDPQGIGYHVNQALLAIGSGGFWGVGYGHSRQKFQYLPEVAGDSIFAVVAEELGFVASILILLGFSAMLWRMLDIARTAPDRFSRFVVIGIASWFVLQAFVNIGSMLAILPITGIPLPFISYGGTALAVSLSAVGVVLNVSKYRR